MTPWADWTPDVAIDVPGCPTPTIERAVKQTVIDFCERTHWVKRTATPIDVPPGTAARTFGTPVISSGEAVLAILKAWLSSEPFAIKSADDVDDEWPNWKAMEGDPECIVLDSIDSYYVVPAPLVTLPAALRLKVAVGYTDAATGCDDTIRQHWRDAIADGAKARLLSMAAQQWTLPDHASMHQRLYLDAIKSASIRAIRTPARRPLVTKPYWF